MDIWHDPLFLAALKKGGAGGTASGDIVTFTAPKAAPLKALTLAIDPVQAGTGDPSPDNVRPISGWDGANLWRTGRNLLDINRTLGAPVPTDVSNTTSPRVFDVSKYYKGARSDNYYYANYVNASIESNAVIVTVVGGNVSYGVGFPVRVSGGRSYAFRANSENGVVSFGFYDAWWHWLSGTDAVVLANSGGTATVIAPAKAEYMLIVLRSTAVNLAATFTDIQLELGSTPTAYTPYTGTTIPVTFTEAGTVYGGTLDVLSGVLTVDKGITNLEEGMTLGGIGATPIWAKTLADAKTVPNKDPANLIAEAYKVIRFNAIAPNVGHVALRDTKILYVNTGSADIMPVGKLVYELATPLTYTLTPQQLDTLAGQNVVWGDSGAVSLEYAGGGVSTDMMLAAILHEARQ